MLARAVTNLLDNALRHSPDGGEVRVRRSLADDTSASIAVSNDGTSIAPDQVRQDLRAVLERVSQTEGRGLGLAIARQIAERARWHPRRALTGSRR